MDENVVTPQVHAVFEHQKASSACCGDKLQLPAEGAEHEYECAGCGQPAARLLADPVEHHAFGGGA